MNSTDVVVTFSFHGWLKLNNLSLSLKTHFCNDLYQILTNSNFQEKITAILEKNSIVITFISLYQNLDIITLLTKDKSNQFKFKIISFIDPYERSNSLTAIKNSTNIVTENISISPLTNHYNNPREFNSIIESNYQVDKQDFIFDDRDFICYISAFKDTRHIYIVSPEQYKILHKNPQLPLLITGNIGTGKTMTGLFSALDQAHRLSKKGEEKILYLTDNKFSVKDAKKIINHFGLNEQITVYDYLLLNKSILEKYPLIFTQKFLAQRQVTLYKFTEQFFKPRKIFNLKVEDLWQEIRHIIKGSTKLLQGSKSLISFEEYLVLKNQSLFPSNTDFKLIYHLATEYQEWLESQNYWDDLDLTRYLLTRFPDNYKGEYEAIYIDGINKFTELQLQFILKLLKVKDTPDYLPQIFLIGENDNNLNAKNIAWNRGEKIIVENYYKLPTWKQIRELIEPHELTYNFNYVDNIVKLGMTIATLAGKNYHHFSWHKSPFKPLIISEITPEFLMYNNHLNIDSAIVVFDEQERNILANIFPSDSQRIINFSEIENLEFDQVLVWKMFEQISKFTEQQLGDDREILNKKYQYLYSLTKIAKKRLYFYDKFIDDIWSDTNINSLIDIGYETELESIFTEKYSEAEINIIADNYLKKGTDKVYQIVSQIYHSSNNIIGAAKVEALLEEEQGNWGKAGDMWNKLGIFDEAINCWNEVDKKLWLAKWAVLSSEEWQKRGFYFEEEKDYKLAKFCYEKSNDFEGKLRCLEKDNWELAGDECQSKNLISQANKYYELADKYYRTHEQWTSAIKMWTKLDKWDRVAIIWEELQQWEKAANCWQKQGNVEKAAFCWQKAEKWTAAQKCWEELGNWQELALSYEKEQNWDLAAQTWLKIADTEKAALCYQKATRWHQAEILWQELGYWGFVAICLQQQNKWEEAAVAWSKTNPYELEALCHEQCQAWDKAEKCWLAAKNWTRIILACEKQGKWQEAAESWENLGEWQKAGLAWEKINEIEKAGLCYEEGEYWQLAEKCWTELQRSDRRAKVLEKQERWQESAQIWEKLGEWEKAGHCWQNMGEIEKAALCYEEGKHWRLAEECWQQLENWERVENACKQQGTWQKAAYDWLKVNHLEKAALCYENCQDWERAAKYWQKSENWEKYAHACEQLQQWELAANSYLRANKEEKAGYCYEKAEDWSHAEECWRKLWKWEKLAMVCEYQQKWTDAGKAWLLINEIERAGLCFENGKDWEKAEDCWRKLSQWEKLATVCEYQEKWEEAAQLWVFLEKWDKAGLVCKKMDDLETAIKYYEKGGYFAEADECRRQLF